MLILPEDVQAIKESVRKLVNNELIPKAREIDESDEFPWDIRKKFADLGIFALGFPEEYGGEDGRWLTFCAVMEEIARGNAAFAMHVGGQALAPGPIVFAGSEEQKKKYISRLAAGEIIPAFALTEPEAGSDASAIKTKAVRDGKEYVINGNKCFITSGNIADIVTVAAKTTDLQTGKKGISLFIVEKGTPGFSYGAIEKKMGLHGSPTAELIFEDVRIPAENLIGNEGDGFKILMHTLNRSRIMVGAQCLGISQAALDEAVKYARVREQFGQAISKFQGVQFLLAEMQTLVQACRNFVYDAAARWDAKKATTLYSSMTKLFCSEASVKITDKAVQVFGGYGYVRDYHVERLMRDARHAPLVEGTTQIQKLIIARELLGKNYV